MEGRYNTMKSNLQYVEVSENGKVYIAHYRSGAERWYTRNTVPYTVLYFYRVRLGKRPDLIKKVTVPAYDGKKLYEQIYYRALA